MANALPPTVTAGSGGSINPGRPLETIGAAADRVFKLINELDAFLVRFNGPNPAADGPGDPIAVCYTNEILRLHANIETLSRQFDALCALG